MVEEFSLDLAAEASEHPVPSASSWEHVSSTLNFVFLVLLFYDILTTDASEPIYRMQVVWVLESEQEDGGHAKEERTIPLLSAS